MRLIRNLIHAAGWTLAGTMLSVTALAAAAFEEGLSPELAERLAKRSGSPVYVGGDSNCDYTSLNDAIANAPAGSEIRLANTKIYNNAPYFLNRSMNLIGGYDQCQGLRTGRTQLQGGLQSRVLAIESLTGAELSTILANLEIGTGSASSGGGGGIGINGGHDVLMVDFLMGFNSADDDGGAIRVLGGAELWLAINGEIAVNSAGGNGGAISCEDSSIRIDQGVTIRNNSADGDGGGIYTDNCALEFGAGYGSDFSGLRNNSADGNGGAIYARGGSQLEINGASPFFSDTVNPVLISGNQANNGAGLYLVGSTTEAELTNTVLVDNEAESGGAAIVVNVASLVMEYDPDSNCTRQRLAGGSRTCSQIVANRTTGTGIHSIINVFNNGSVTLRGTDISENSIDTGGIISLSNGTLNIENSLIADNISRGDSGSNSAVIRLGGLAGSTASIGWSTLSNHQGPLIGDSVIDMFAGNSASNTISLQGLVVYQPGANVIGDRGAGSNEVFRPACVMAPETQSITSIALPGSITNVRVADPRLVDPDNGIHRLRANSPAINDCFQDGSIGLVPPQRDMDGFLRGQSASSTPYDLGAFERAGEMLFRDRFQ